MAQRIITLILLLCSTSAFAGLFDAPGRSNFVPADRAFAFDFKQNDHSINLNWQIQDGYYLYRKQIKITPAQATLSALQLPDGQTHEDEFFGKSEVYRKQLTLPLNIEQAGKGATLTVTYQGCAEAGLCYPPETKVVPLSEVSALATPATPSASATGATSGESDTDKQPDKLPFSALWALIVGIGISFTPCVLPMYPLISGIVLGGQRRLSTSRALFLSFSYVQGMVVTYTLLGIVVAAAGLKLQAALQNPYVLIGLSAVFTLLALSMFGLFSLQLPSSVQTHLALLSNRQQGGSAGGVFVMGAIAGLICSPCTTAPLSAILLYIAQSGNLWLGGGTLYLYALGMGIPLIIVTTFGNHLLPKHGPWMARVKTAFGFVILILPIFLLERVFGEVWGARMWAALSVSFFAWAFLTSLNLARSWGRMVQILLLAGALISVRPLQDWIFNIPIQQQQAHLNFTRVANTDELQQALAQAKGKPVMLDLYADWCVACKEFEKNTFSDPLVQQALSNTVLLQANVTKNAAQELALMKELNVMGLPTILFFNAAGEELPAQRVTGYLDADAFHRHLQNLPQ
ncbi:protein-disulfide reductase DsbD [[Enterobacter] lignolyticus]|uniref:Thiol:disulfide interchange protein DsbD n=1 Tax=Enterobacter lignolyticus (strain SCF1) TaxID=701347 RepID=E3G1G9_ENTLS|nr:protein-disulfide reductase DsbD [[Enterobacter] lignolyticus]ADO50254.1 Protein-disulfide reductase [[Enterobacter] lignolyticus SCF1]